MVMETSEPYGGSQEDYNSTQASIKAECTALWQEVQEIQKELDKINKPVLVVSEDAQLQISAAKEKLLKAQIRVLKEYQPNYTEKPLLVTSHLAQDELKKSIKGLQEMLSCAESTGRQLQQEKEKEEVFRTKISQIKEAIQSKLYTAEEQEEVADSSSRELEDLKSQNIKVTKYYKKLMKSMSQFIHEQFPEPSAEQLEAWKTKYHKQSLGSEMKDTSRGIVSLQDMLQELLNQCIDHPHDPYINLATGNYWKPYIELLTRSGIAIKHADTDSLLKLTPYHL